MAKYNQIDYEFEVFDDSSKARFKVQVLPEDGDDIDALRRDVRRILRNEKERAEVQILGDEPET